MCDFLKQPWVQILLIVIGLVAILWLFWPKGVPRPDEANRQSHPAGYSVVVPPGYVVHVDRVGNPTKADSIAAEDPNYSSFAPRFQVDRFREPPDLQRLMEERRFKPGATFLGRDAYVFDGPRGPLWHHRIVFEAAGQWFEIGVALPDYHDVPNDRWYEYFKSFRYEPPSGADRPRPTTSPAPSTTQARS